MILFLHNRYRTTGGEERVVDELLALVRERLGEPAELLARDSARVGGARAAAGLLRGGLGAREVAKAVHLTGARVLHAHNLSPLFGWRALAAARAEGARVVLHLHQYRLVCATGVCFTEGQECVRCHGRNTLPGVIHNCRGSRAEAFTYGASLALWQRRLVAQADVLIVPSVFARERLRELGAPLDFERVRVLPPPVRMPNGREAQAPVATPSAESMDRPAAGSYALVVSRLAPEKGVDIAVEACRIAGVPLVVAGDGPEMGALRARARTRAPHPEMEYPHARTEHPQTRPQACTGHPQTPTGHPPARTGHSEKSTPPEPSVHGEVRFVGRVDDAELEHLREGAALAIVPSRSAETFGMAAAEAMAAGVPVVASRIGALPELVEQDGLVDPGDVTALAEAIGRRWRDVSAGERGRARVAELCGPQVVADKLAAIYGTDRPAGRRP
jgi:glycosyltransferase involved in cell wall biosynthesis